MSRQIRNQSQHSEKFCILPRIVIMSSDPWIQADSLGRQYSYIREISSLSVFIVLIPRPCEKKFFIVSANDISFPFKAVYIFNVQAI